MKDFSIDCADRESTVILGPIDAGKTTVLRLIAGLETPAAGEIFVGDRAVQSLPPHQRDLALVSRDAPLLPHLSVETNLQLALRQRKIAREAAARRIRDVSALLGLESLLGKKPPALTPLDRRRAEIARAYSLQPKAILVDDPLGGLDPAARDHLRCDLARLQDQFHATLIYATDDSSEAMTLSTRLILIRHGTVVQEAAPIDVYREPVNVFAAAALGNPGMNFIRGALKGPSGAIVFKESEGGALELKLGDRPAAEGHIGRDVLLGIRPEDCVAVAEDAQSAPGIFQVLVDFVESRGGDTLFHAQTGAHAFISRSPGAIDPRAAGRRARFRIDPARTHLFDPASTRRIA